MNFVAGIVGRIITKRVGSTIGGSLFNHSVTSCDGIDVCGPCCFDRKEADRKSMYVCGSNSCKENKQSNLGGVNTCSQINLTNDLTAVPLIYIDKETSRLIMLNYKRELLVDEFKSFNLEYFYTALLLTLSGNNLEMTVSLNPVDNYTLKCTLKPDFIVRDRLVGDILFICDWLLKCLGFGTFIDESTGVDIPFDNNIQKQLDAIGYKSILQLNKETATSGFTGAKWLEPEYININIVDNVLYPAIGITCYTQTDINDKCTPLFATWVTNHFDEITKIFPIFNELRELIVTLSVVKVLRYYDIDLYQYESLAVKHLQMSDYLNPHFTDLLFKYHVFESGSNKFISGGIVNNYSINRHDDNEKQVYIRVVPTNPIHIDSNLKAILTVLSELRLKLGSIISIHKDCKIRDLIMKFAIISKFDPTWLEFYNENDYDNKLDYNDNIPNIVYLKINITQTSETSLRILLSGGALVV